MISLFPFCLILLLRCGVGDAGNVKALMSHLWTNSFIFKLLSFDADFGSGNKKSSCSFEIEMKDEDTADITIVCSKAKKKIPVKDFVWTSKTMKIFTLSFNIPKSPRKSSTIKDKDISRTVVTGRAEPGGLPV